MKFSTATVGLTAYHTHVATVYTKMSVCDIASVTVSLSETNRTKVTVHFSGSTVTFVFEYCTNVSLPRIIANGYDRTITVILAKHCIKLPDNGSLVIRNMLEQF